MAKTTTRKTEILQVITKILEEEGVHKVTTAHLAKSLGLSEGSLYRHYSSKVKMFEGLIDFIEESIFTMYSQVQQQYIEDGKTQITKMALLLTTFAEKNKGLVRVLTGECLCSDPALKVLNEKLSNIYARLELSFKNGFNMYVLQHQDTVIVPRQHANLLSTFILGLLLKYSLSNYQINIASSIKEQLDLLFNDKQ